MVLVHTEPEQMAACWLRIACGGDTSVDPILVARGLAVVYGDVMQCPPPQTMVVLDSPRACVDISEALRRGETPPRMNASIFDLRFGRPDPSQKTLTDLGETLGRRLEEVALDRVEGYPLVSVGYFIRDWWGQCGAGGASSVEGLPQAVLTRLHALSLLRTRGRKARPEDALQVYGVSHVGLRTYAPWALYLQRAQRPPEEGSGAFVDLLRGGTWETVLFEGVAFISRRPRQVRYDALNRLHCTTGPAVEFADGHGAWYLEGVEVPPGVVRRPERLGMERVLRERNQELRRIMLSRMGWERFVTREDCVVVHEDLDGAGMGRRLLRVEVAGHEPVSVVEVNCPSTRRRYLLRVPPHLTRCHAAVAWTFGLDEGQYVPDEEA